MCRSRQELSNAHLLAKFGFDTAENEPCKVCPLSAYRSPRCVSDVLRVLSGDDEFLELTFSEIAFWIFPAAARCCSRAYLGDL